jgi:hypothetical protein
MDREDEDLLADIEAKIDRKMCRRKANAETITLKLTLDEATLLWDIAEGACMFLPDRDTLLKHQHQPPLPSQLHQ